MPAGGSLSTRLSTVVPGLSGRDAQAMMMTIFCLSTGRLLPLWSQHNIYIPAPAQHNASEPLKDRNEILTTATEVTIRLASFAPQESFSWDIGKPVCVFAEIT